jgi:integrase
MLRFERKHVAGCTSGAKCKRCPYWIEGRHGGRRWHQSLHTTDSRTAAQLVQRIILAGELTDDTPTPTTTPAPAVVTVAQAIAAYRQFKQRRSADTVRKIKLLTHRLATFLESRGVGDISAVTLPDLVGFRASWRGAPSTQRRDQEILKSFFWFCYHSGFIVRNPVVHLDPISVTRPKTEPFTHAEQVAIFEALPAFPDEYGRRGTAIAELTRAFVLVLRYTGMSIGDVAKLQKTDVLGRRIRTWRKKTGEDVFAVVPQFVIDALWAAPHDSEEYFFWSGKGLLHTRASKWGDRLRKLFKLANLPGATPYKFRHTLARDFLENGGSMAELAELLGNSPRICERYYSKWDRRRQARLEQNLDALRENDPITALLTPRRSQTSPAPSPVPIQE